MDVRCRPIGHHRLMVVAVGLLIGSAAGCGSEPERPFAAPAASSAPAAPQADVEGEARRRLGEPVLPGRGFATPVPTLPGSEVFSQPGSPTAAPTSQPATPTTALQLPTVAMPPTVAPPPTIAVNSPAGGSGLTPALVAVLIVLVAAAGLGVVLLRRGRVAPSPIAPTAYRYPPPIPPTSPPRPPPTVPTVPTPAGSVGPPRIAPDPDLDVLGAALRQVAVAAPGAAVREQIERLLAGGQASRRDLVNACVRYRDQLAERDPRIGEGLAAALRSAGVREVRADGERFDPDRHEVIDTVDTEDPQRHDHVASTLAPGYADRGNTLRLPQVCLYRARSEGGAP